MNVNDSPAINGTPATTVDVGSLYTFTPVAVDPDEDELSFSILNRPGWATFDTSTGVLTGIPTSTHVGVYSGIGISVTDGALTAGLPPFTIEVVAALDALPIIWGTPPTSVMADSLYSFTPDAFDPNLGSITFSIESMPDWAGFNTEDGTLSGTPAEGDLGMFADVVITVSNGPLTASLPAFSIEVVAANAPPIISGTPLPVVMVNSFYSFTPDAVDPNLGQTLFFTITGQPSWANFNTGTGTLSGSPAVGDLGFHNDIVITVSDGTLTDSLPAFNIEVDRDNVSPVADAGPDQFVVAGETITLDGSASYDPDVIDTITFVWNQIGGTVVGLSSNTVEQPTFGAPAVSEELIFVLTVSDGVNFSAADAVSITVSTDINPTATIDTTDYPIMVEGGSVYFSATASGGNGPLAYSWDFPGGTPASAAVEDPGSVMFDTLGTFTVSFTVTDVDGDSDTQTLEITVVRRKARSIESDQHYIFVLTPLSRRKQHINSETRDVFTATPYSLREPVIITETYSIDIVPP